MPCALTGGRAQTSTNKVAAHRHGHRNRGCEPPRQGPQNLCPLGALFRRLESRPSWNVRFTARPRKRGRPAYSHPRSRWQRKVAIARLGAILRRSKRAPSPRARRHHLSSIIIPFFPTPPRLRSVTNGPARCAQKQKRAHGAGAQPAAVATPLPLLNPKPSPPASDTPEGHRPPGSYCSPINLPLPSALRAIGPKG